MLFIITDFGLEIFALLTFCYYSRLEGGGLNWKDSKDITDCPFSGASGKFWYISSNGLVCADGEKAEDFFLEFLEHGRIGIKGSNGKYLRGDQGGTLKGDGTTVDASSLWEY